MEKIKEAEYMEEACSIQEFVELKEFYGKIDEGINEVVNITETSTEKINTPSLSPTVNPGKDITLQIQLSENVDQGSQQSFQMITPPHLK